MPGARDLGFELIPPDDEEFTAEEAVEAATAAALDDAPTAVPGDEPVPFGRTWEMDPTTGRFVMRGGSPAVVDGVDSLRQWILMAIHTARFAHDVFSDEFGVEDPESIIGDVLTEEMVADYERRLREALLVHDRIAAMENFRATFDAGEGVLTIESLDIVTDEDELISVADEVISARDRGGV